MRAGPGLMYRTFLKRIETVKPAGKCLEVGAGTGALSCLLAQDHPGITITASDISPHMVDLARKNVRENGLDRAIRCICADVNNDKEMGPLGTFDPDIFGLFAPHSRDPPVLSLKPLGGAGQPRHALYP